MRKIVNESVTILGPAHDNGSNHGAIRRVVWEWAAVHPEMMRGLTGRAIGAGCRFLELHI